MKNSVRKSSMITLSFWQDLRYGARVLLKNPGPSLIAIFTLSLGIGANTTVFNLVNALLLRPLPVERPDELVAVYTGDFGGAQYGSSSYPDYLDFRGRNQVFSGMAAYQVRPFSLDIDGTNDRAFGEIVSGNYFSMLEIRPALGRGFLPDEDKTPGERPVVVISHRLWRNRFGGDPSIVNRTIRLNGHSFTIVGVAPERYTGLTRGIGIDLWVPAMMIEQASPGGGGLTERGSRSFQVLGRLKPGVTVERAKSDFGLISAQLFAAWPQQWENVRKEPRVISLIPESQAQVPLSFRTSLVLFMAMLMTVVGLVLLMACANVASLLLARALSRRKEIAIRLSLGAGRGRLIRQLITESALMSLLGGLAGLLLAEWAANLLMTVKPSMQPPIEIDLRSDWRVFGFTLGLSLLTGLIFGSIPALAASRPDIIATLKDKAGVGRAGERLRGALVIVQVALSLMLLICCGLFIRSLRNAGAIDPGFDADNLLMASMDLELQGYQESGRRNFSGQLLNRVRALPVVESASLTDRLPLGATRSRATITIEGYTTRQGESAEVLMSSVAPGYFETLRIPLQRGRSFNERDQAGAPGVAIVNETFARRFWPGQEPIGKRIQLGYSPTGVNESPYLEVVGVAKDGKYVSLGEEPQPFFYLNLWQRDQSSPTLIVRTRGATIDYLPMVRNEALALDKNLSLYDVKTMKQHLGLSLLPAQLAGGVLGVFGLMALVLAASGIYGVISYSVAQRTREIGIRMAMGASAGAVLRLVVKYGLALTLIGMAFGLTASLALTRLMKTMLIGVSATDPLTFTVIVLLFMAVAMLACYIPARRAAKVDPMIALRCE